MLAGMESELCDAQLKFRPLRPRASAMMRQGERGVASAGSGQTGGLRKLSGGEGGGRWLVTAGWMARKSCAGCGSNE